ncbi:MAG: AAA family ATPase [Thiobacillus sp.]
MALLSYSPENLETLRRMVSSWDGAVAITGTEGEPEIAGPLAEQERPDVLVVDSRCENVSAMGSLETTTARFPAMTVVLLCPETSADLMREAMRIGVREMLPSPPDPQALLTALERVRQRLDLSKAPRKAGRIMSWIGCKGGSGATFLASNFAYALAASGSKRVAMIDLNLQFGDAALFLSDQPPQTTLADVVKQIRRLDGALLAASMIHVTPNCHVLAAPENLEEAGLVKPEQLDMLLSVAASHYDYVILDLGRSLDALSLRALDKSDAIFLAIQLTLPFIRDCKRLIHALTSLGYGQDKLSLVVNRHEKGGDITVQDAERVLGQKITKIIPNSYRAVAASVNQGVPLLKLAPRDPVGKTLAELAATIEVPAKSTGWLRDIFKG